MEQQQSSATMAMDPDRKIQKEFAENCQNDTIVILSEEGANRINDVLCATFSIKNQDHTIGNALRHVISQYSDVDFCGYSVPHPSEYKIHFRIQSKGPATAKEIMIRGLYDLKGTFEQFKRNLNQAWEANDYISDPNKKV